MIEKMQAMKYRLIIVIGVFVILLIGSTGSLQASATGVLSILSTDSDGQSIKTTNQSADSYIMFNGFSSEAKQCADLESSQCSVRMYFDVIADQEVVVDVFATSPDYDNKSIAQRPISLPVTSHFEEVEITSPGFYTVVLHLTSEADQELISEVETGFYISDQSGHYMEANLFLIDGVNLPVKEVPTQLEKNNFQVNLIPTAQEKELDAESTEQGESQRLVIQNDQAKGDQTEDQGQHKPTSELPKVKIQTNQELPNTEKTPTTALSPEKISSYTFTSRTDGGRVAQIRNGSVKPPEGYKYYCYYSNGGRMTRKGQELFGQYICKLVEHSATMSSPSNLLGNKSSEHF